VPAGKAAVEAGTNALSLINTIQSVTGVDLDTFVPNPYVAGKSVYGGYCGPAVKPIALKFQSPSQAEDIHEALAWLRLNARQLKIDTNNFVLTGRSAGAQLVLATAYSGKENGIKGVAAFYGPTDMLWTYDHPDNMLIMDSRMVQRDFLGGTPAEVPKRYNAESPLFYVTLETVPTLLVHGKLDAHVYHEQSVRLANKLDAYKVKNVFLSLPWATHGCEYNLNGPSGQLAMYAVERFLFAVTRMEK
jgi:acetyl esterase/lipase